MSTGKRKFVACSRCHKKKIKCPGGSPCQNCALAGTHCTYPFRDRNVSVSEAYLANLQAQSNSQMHSYHSDRPPLATPSIQAVALDESPFLSLPGLSPTEPRRKGDQTPVLKDSTAESFVSGLKKLSRPHADNTPAGADPWDASLGNKSPSVQDELSHYEYVPLEFDTSTSRVTVKLPPYPYAKQLLQQFEAYIGHEYHWYMRKSFHADLESTYRKPHSSQARDRLWLCKLLTALALGESYNACHAPNIEISGTGVDQAIPIHPPTPTTAPGAAFFEQSLSLFKVPSEEPTIAHVEALNLIAFYCYSLNRRKTAYTYTGLAVRVSSLLALHQPSSDRSPATAEHYKRVWWTTFLMDNMTSTEVGVKPALRFSEAEQAMPANDGLSPEDQADFADAGIQTMHLHLCDARNDILTIATRLQQDDLTNYSHKIQHPMEALTTWRSSVPEKYSFDFAEGMPTAMQYLPSMRSLASVYLRYHQGFILLIRPIYIKLLAIALGKDSSGSSLDLMVGLGARCLEAAKCNMQILVALSRLDKLARYGFWESLHLFSAISIFALARLTYRFPTFNLDQRPEDHALYETAKDLLSSMAINGNAAAKGHVRLINEIDRMLDAVFAHTANSDMELTIPMADLEQEIFQWIESIDNVDQYPH